MAMPPPLSPLFVRLLFAISVLSWRGQRFAARRVLVFSILSIDSIGASQKGSFLVDRGAARVGLPSRCLTHSNPALPSGGRNPDRTRNNWMPAGWVSVVSDQITDSNQGPTIGYSKTAMRCDSGFSNSKRKLENRKEQLTSKRDPIQIEQSSFTCDLLPTPDLLFYG